MWKANVMAQKTACCKKKASDNSGGENDEPKPNVRIVNTNGEIELADADKIDD